MKARMRILDGSGHSTVEWDTEVKDGRSTAAKAEFTRLVENGRALAFDTRSKPGEPIERGGFNPEEHSDVLIMPPMAGG